MKCQSYKELFQLYLNGTIDPELRSDLERHLESCSDCRKEYEEIKSLWNLMGEMTVPEPSEAMRTGFNAILSNYREYLRFRRFPVDEFINKIREIWYQNLRPRVAYSLLFVAIGLTTGYLLHKPGSSAISYNRQIDSLSVQVSEMKQILMLSLLQNPSASQRIKAVAYTDEITNVDLKVIDALFATLNEDSNVNVRLATLEALVKYSYKPEVREGLVRSINLQESPLMQSAIADVMVRLQEKSSVPSLQKLLSKKDLNQMVKINLQKNINKLI